MNKIFILITAIISFGYSQSAIVDTNVLLIKKHPSHSSATFGFYKQNESIDVLEEEQGIDNDDIWYKTIRGYVRKKYVILNSQLPNILKNEDVDTNKYAIQLIVYPIKAVKSLKNAIKLLKDEENIYIKQTKKANVIFLVNLNSYREAIMKKKTLKKFDAFITKIKLNDNVHNINNNISKNENKIEKELIKKPKKELIKNKKIVNTQPIKDILIDEYEDDDIEDIINNIDNNKKQILKVVEKNIEVKKIKINKIINPKQINKKQIISINKNEKSLNFMIEDILIKLNH